MAGANMEAKDCVERTPLHLAARYGYTDMAEVSSLVSHTLSSERGGSLSSIEVEI